MTKSSLFVGSSERNLGIDFLRAVAILYLMLRHFLDRNPAYDKYLPSIVTDIGLFGWSGVDLFFVLSGFFIFSIIFEEEARGAFAWVNFYSKRALRIWPAYFASLAVCFLSGQFNV